MPTCSYMPIEAILSYCAGEVLVAAELDRDLPLQSEPLHLGERVVVLLLRERHPVRVDAVARGGVAKQPAPAAADVEEAIARLEAQLAADHVELVGLRALQRVVPIR